MCFGCSKEPSHRDGSFEYPQHMFWLRNKKNNFQFSTLIWGPAGRYTTVVSKLHDTMMLTLLNSGKFCHLLITFANSLDPDEDRLFVCPDLDPNCLPL